MHNNGPYQYQSTHITRCSDTTKIDFILVGGNPTLMFLYAQMGGVFPGKSLKPPRSPYIRRVQASLDFMILLALARKQPKKNIELRVCKSIRGWVKGFFFGLSKQWQQFLDIPIFLPLFQAPFHNFWYILSRFPSLEVSYQWSNFSFSRLEDIALCWEVWCSFRRHTWFIRRFSVRGYTPYA